MRSADVAEPGAVSVVIPACNESAAIGGVVRELLSAARWREVLVIDDGSTDETSARATEAGARVIRHPYNKGNGAAVKSGIRAATGDFVIVAPPGNLTAGLVLCGFVSAANTVTIRIINGTAGAIDPASATFGIAVLPAS